MSQRNNHHLTPRTDQLPYPRMQRYCDACQARHEGRGRGHPGGIAAGQKRRAASNGGTVPRGGANKSLTTDTPVGIRS